MYVLGVGGKWDGRVSRKGLPAVGALGAAALSPGSGRVSAWQRAGRADYDGPTKPDPRRRRDLPRRFRYRAISRGGSRLSDGPPVLGDHDGVAAVRDKVGTTGLVRNHELGTADANTLDGRYPSYDPTQVGATTAIALGSCRRVIRSRVAPGARNNGAGGATPWGTRLTCDGNRATTGERGHGYVFGVDPTDPENGPSRTPTREMGRFSHGAVDVDPRTGICHPSEDGFEDPVDEEDRSLDTRRSYLYRLLPGNRRWRPVAPSCWGALQAAKLEESPIDPGFIEQGQRFAVRWTTVDPETPRDDAPTVDDARFDRLGGALFEGGVFWYDDPAGGERSLVRVFPRIFLRT